MIVRCIDNLFQTDVLVEGREYEVRAERDDCYILSGFDKAFSKTRFEIVKRCAAGARIKADDPSQTPADRHPVR